MLILSMLFVPFRPPRPGNAILASAPHVPSRENTGCWWRQSKRACMAAEDLAVAAGHRKTLPIFALGPGENPWGFARYGLR
jgi:hypothetical protein